MSLSATRHTCGARRPRHEALAARLRGLVSSPHYLHIQPHAQMTTMATVYKPTEAIQLLRPVFRIHRGSRLGTAAFSTTRSRKATQSSTSGNPPPPSTPQRRAVTITNDTGAVRWSELSIGEKAARTTQQSFNFIVVIAGVVLTVLLPLSIFFYYC